MQNIDFLPERIKERRARHHRLIRQAYLLVVCLIAMAALGYIRQVRITRAEAQIVLLGHRVTNVRQQLAMRADLERQQAELLIKKRIDDLLGSRVNTLDLQAELERVLPPSMTLTRLNIEAVEVRVPVEPVKAGVAQAARGSHYQKEKTIKRVRVSLTGLAPTDVAVANFIGQLSASPVFEDVNMDYTKNVIFRNHLAREFQTICYVVK